jgi:hypothetical protein
MSSNVTLIFTQHRELGLCSSDALLRIIESVKPEVIFEELSEDNYRRAYSEGTLNNLESVAIRKYVKTHDIPHVPVDTFERPKNYDKDQSHLYGGVTSSAGVHSFHLRGLLDQHEAMITQFGFTYLNSHDNEKVFEAIDKLKLKVLETLNDEALHRMAKIIEEVIVIREDAILDNVYNYIRENNYVNGLMFIGSGHQKSIKKKIRERVETENLKIDWSFLPELKFEKSN